LKCVLLAMSAVQSEVQSDLISTYYDTPDLALNRKQLTLRVRKQGRKFVQAVKAGDSAGSDLLVRREWEDPIASKRPNIDAPKTGKQLPASIRKQDLRPVFTTSITRTAIKVEPHSSTQIEAAIDEGEIRTANGSGVEPISEIELELKSGNPAVLFDVALRLLEAAPSASKPVARPSEAIDSSEPLACRRHCMRDLSLSILRWPSRPPCSASDDNALPICCVTNRSRSRVSRKASTKCEWPCDGFVQCSPR
jgi:hypothetical protein